MLSPVPKFVPLRNQVIPDPLANKVVLVPLHKILDEEEITGADGVVPVLITMELETEEVPQLFDAVAV